MKACEVYAFLFFKLCATQEKRTDRLWYTKKIMDCEVPIRGSQINLDLASFARIGLTQGVNQDTTPTP